MRNSQLNCEVSGLLEPCAGKLASTVLRGGGYGDILSLPDHSALGYASPEAFERSYYQAFSMSTKSA